MTAVLSGIPESSNAAAAEAAGAVLAAALVRQRARWASKGWRYRDPRHPHPRRSGGVQRRRRRFRSDLLHACLSVEYLLPAAVMYGIKAVPDYLLIAAEIQAWKSRPEPCNYHQRSLSVYL